MRQNLGEMERRQNSFDDFLGSQVYERSTRADSPPLVGGDNGVGETRKLENIHHLFHPHLYPPLEGMPSPIKGEGSLGLWDRLEGPF